MNKFIKKNWFKLGILIIMLLGIGIFYITNYQNLDIKPYSDIEIVTLKQKCLKDGNDYISKNFPTNLVIEKYPMNVSERFVYSPELKTCLVNISRITLPLHWYYAVIDIYAEKEIVAYSFDKTDEESWTSQTFKDNYKKYNEMKNKYFSDSQ